MPNQHLSPGAEQGYTNLAGAPGADTSWDELFPPEGTNQQPPQAATEQTPPSQPQAPEAPKPFLQAGETVYLTSEEAAKGVLHKDDYIARARTFLKEKGIDPNTFEELHQQSQTATQQPPSQYTYYGNGKKLFGDLAKAVDSKDTELYERIQAQYNQEAIDAQLAPYAPLLAEVARSRAVRRVTEQAPEFGQFVTSQEFQQVQERLPLLRDAIRNSESNPRGAEQLDQLYQLAYLASKGLRPASAPQQPVTPPAARPTTTSATMTPPPPGAAQRVNEWTTSREARQQLIKDRDAQGFKDIDWRNVGM